MKASKYILIIALLTSFGIVSKAQGVSTDSLQHDLAIIARSYGDSVVIRWAPASYQLWSLANKNGYILDRWTPGQTAFEQIAGPVLPYSLSDWKANADTTDTYVTAAAQALHGKQMVNPTESNALGRKLMAYEEQEGKLAFALLAAEFSTEAATGLGLRFVDTAVSEHNHFLYRVHIANSATDTAQVFIDARKVLQPNPVRQVNLEPQDGVINIIWNKELNDEVFSGYYIEKSSDGKNYKRLNNQPYISSQSPDAIEANVNNYSDSVSENNKTYWYRVIGITSFADEGLPSVVVSGKGKDLSPPKPPFAVIAKENDTQSIQVNWQAEPIEPDHAGYYVLKSFEVNGEYKIISGKEPLKGSATSFIDEHPWPHRPNYYKVVSVDDNGNQSESTAAMGLMKDDIPPAKPMGLIGQVDSLGIVSLAWEVNPEEDLKGYRVFKANSINREFVQITSGPIPGNFYLDTINLKTLTKKVYYKIAAFDFNYNPSEYSEVLELERPDYIPPVKPLMKQAQILTDTVRLEWISSSSKDVEKHVLFKKKGGEDWQLLATFTDSTNFFIDTDLLYGQHYQYVIEAIDENNLRSGKSKEASAFFRKSSVKTVNNLAGTFDQEQKSMKLSWQYEGSQNSKFIIFKGAIDGEMAFYASVSGEKRSFEDQSFYLNDAGYAYSVKVLLNNGRESGLSVPFEVVFEK